MHSSSKHTLIRRICRFYSRQTTSLWDPNNHCSSTYHHHRVIGTKKVLDWITRFYKRAGRGAIGRWQIYTYTYSPIHFLKTLSSPDGAPTKSVALTSYRSVGCQYGSRGPDHGSPLGPRAAKIQSLDHDNRGHALLNAMPTKNTLIPIYYILHAHMFVWRSVVLQ